MYTIGIDLAVTGKHKAVIVDRERRVVGDVVRFKTSAQEMDELLKRAGVPVAQVQVTMEPTGMVWYPIAVYLLRRGATVYLVNTRQVADLRRYFKRHSKSDRIDARVLAAVPYLNPDKLHPLSLPGARHLACQRACREANNLQAWMTAIKNRLYVIDRFAWPGLEQVFPDPFGIAARWMREHWYDPFEVLVAGTEAIRNHWQETWPRSKEVPEWINSLVQLAGEVVAIYGSPDDALDYSFAQAEVQRYQRWLDLFEQVHHDITLHTVRPLYRQLHPTRNLESIYGVGQDSAAIYASFMGSMDRFGSAKAFRGWSGMVPQSRQSSDTDTKGLHVTRAGPNLIKRTAYIDAEVARRWDPQLAAIYHDQVVNKGKHHRQAICTCATHLLDRVRVVLDQDRPYQLRDVDGTPVTPHQAQQIIAQQYAVSPTQRQRTSKRTRRRRTERRAERKQLKQQRRESYVSSQQADQRSPHP
jgi:transposase